MINARRSSVVRKRTEKTVAKKESDALALLTKARKAGEKCGQCGHWSTATEYGVDDKSGYCNRWEKLTDRDFWCDEFLSQEQFQKMQSQLAEENEDFVDDEN